VDYSDESFCLFDLLVLAFADLSVRILIGAESNYPSCVLREGLVDIGLVGWGTRANMWCEFETFL